MNNNKNYLHPRNILLISACCLLVFTILSSAPAAYAQGASMSTNAMEKSHWYTAPREYQIIDGRPVIRDFREAPANAGQIGLPPGPGAGGGSGAGGGPGVPTGGGPGAGGQGDLGGGTGVNPVIPANGLALPGTGPGYKADAGLSSLPKVNGFGGTNIPAGGMGPRGILPNVTTGVIGKLMNQNNRRQQAMAATPARGISVKGPSGGGKPSGPPTVASYGGYGNGNPASYGSSLREEKKVRGYLLNH